VLSSDVDLVVPKELFVAFLDPSPVRVTHELSDRFTDGVSYER